MPNIVVQLPFRRSAEQKKALGKNMAEAVQRSIGMPPDRVNIYFEESSHYKDGQLSDDHELFHDEVGSDK